MGAFVGTDLPVIVKVTYLLTLVVILIDENCER
jgi:hypothetical protein